MSFPSGSPLNLSDAPRHYAAGYISATAPVQQQPADSTDTDDWITCAPTHPRTGPSTSNHKSSYRPGGLFAPIQNVPPRVTRSHGLFGSNTKLANTSKSKRLSEAALEDDAPPKVSLFDQDLSPSRPRNDLTGHRSLVSSHSTPQLPEPTKETHHKIYIFGFTSTQQSYILNHFKTIGEFSEPPELSNGNWLVLTYKEISSAQRALRKNGEVLGGVIMIGCKPFNNNDLHLSLPDSDIGKEKGSGLGLKSKVVKTFDLSENVFAVHQGNNSNNSSQDGIRSLVNGVSKPNPAIFQKLGGGNNKQDEVGNGLNPNSYFNRVLDFIFGW